MATRAPFLTQPYGAYYHRDVPHEDEELTHVGPGIPYGEYLRRFWQPVARENVIAGTDCGLGGRLHPEIVWAKFQAMTAEGARLASEQLWRR